MGSNQTLELLTLLALLKGGTVEAAEVLRRARPERTPPPRRKAREARGRR